MPLKKETVLRFRIESPRKTPVQRITEMHQTGAVGSGLSTGGLLVVGQQALGAECEIIEQPLGVFGVGAVGPAHQVAVGKPA